MSERFRNDRGSPLVFRLQLLLQPDSAYSGPAFTQNPAAHGGRLILYHGWNDHLIAPGEHRGLLHWVLYTMGVTRTNESVRLFMAPGTMHLPRWRLGYITHRFPRRGANIKNLFYAKSIVPNASNILRLR